MEIEKIKINLASSKRYIFKETPKAKLDNKEQDVYFIEDLHNTYQRLYESCDQKTFAMAVSQLYKKKMILNQNPKFSVLCLNDKLAKAKINEIISEKFNKATRKDLRTLSDSEELSNKPALKITCDIDNLDSSEEVISKKFKTSFDIQEKPVQVADFDVIKSKIIGTFKKCPIIATSGFNGAMCNTYGNAFNFKECPCSIPYHKHASLTKYFQCCKDFTDILTLKNSYIRLKTSEMCEIVDKRIKFYFQMKKDTKFAVYIEALATNLFSVKTTLPLCDFIDIFDVVYKNDYFRSMKSPKDFILGLKSPNFYVLNNNNVFTVTVNSMSDSTYKEFASSEIHNKIFQFEKKILSSECEDEEVNNFDKNVSSEFIFEDSRHKNLLDICDMNIPKHVLVPRSEPLDPQIKYSPEWKYLNHNLSWNDKLTYFL
jgi:hypothetical protein